jgi:hypothetical protein
MQCVMGYLTVGTVPEIVRCTRPLRRRPYSVAPLGANKPLLPSSLLNPGWGLRSSCRYFPLKCHPHTVRHIRTDISAELEAFVNRHSYSLIMDVADFSETSVPICRSTVSHPTSSYFLNMFLYIFSTSARWLLRLLCIYVEVIQK